MEPVRGGVGIYEELSPSDMEADVDAVFGSWTVAVGGDNAILFREIPAVINCVAVASIGGGFLRAIRKGGGAGETRRGGIGVKVGSVDGKGKGNGREKRKEGCAEESIARSVYEEWERERRVGSVWVWVMFWAA